MLNRNDKGNIQGVGNMGALRLPALFATGGLLHIAAESLWYGRTQWTVFFIGGISFALIGFINEVFTWDMPLVRQMALSTVFISGSKLLAGLLINPTHGIWDYSAMPLNFMGQICLPYTILWFLGSLPAIAADDYLRYWILGEEKPHYTLFREGKEDGGTA